MNRAIQINDISVGKDRPLVLIAGPCVLEDYDLAYTIAAFLKDLTLRLAMPLIFKASYDKANRSAIDSYRGPGMKAGLAILKEIKDALGIAVISDVHQIDEVAPAAEVLDVIQIPAFLCRQTDLITSAAMTGKPINLKKGQFLAPWDMQHVVEKAASTGNRDIFITERGSMFGYNNLVVDFRGVGIMQESAKCPVIFDATHSVQLPGGAGPSSGGQREFAPVLARAAVAAGVDGIFLEVHPDPDKARCDGPNSLPLHALEGLLKQLKAVRKAISN